MNTQQTPANQAPEVRIADRNIKLSGFRQSGKNGDFLGFVAQRSYEDGETIKYTGSFTGDDCLKLARLWMKAYDEHKAFQTAEYEKRQSQTA